jgi:DDE superfamily endonuclease
MTTDQVQTLGPAFTAFLQPFEPFFDTLKTVRHFRTYTRGLLSDLPRKTAEPIAVQAGTAPRNLQQFLKACLWDHAGLTDAVQRTVRAAVAELPADPVGTVGILDETSAVKKGTKTPGVQRQYLGCTGKVENGIVTVHLAVARGRFKALLDSGLYLPASWDADRDRCRAADIPDDLWYRPKWRIGLALLDRAGANGWRFDWLTFDEGYGGKPDFLRRLDLAGVRYVGEVPTTFSCRPGRGRAAISAEAVFSRPGVQRRAARSFRVTQQTGPAAVWQVKVVDVALGHDRRPRHRLILARNRETGERKYFLTNAAKAVGVPRVLAARLRPLERGAPVPGGQERGRADALRGPQLRVADAAPGVVSGGPGVRGAAHSTAAGGKTRRSRRSRCAGPWRGCAADTCADGGGPVNRSACRTSSSIINSETRRPGNHGRNDRDGCADSLRCSVRRCGPGG